MTDGRCAVIGAELVCACGFGKEACIRDLYAGKDAFSPVRRFDPGHLPAALAATVPGLQSEKGESLCVPMLSFLAPMAAELPASTPVLMASTVGEIDRLSDGTGRCTLNLLLEDTLRMFRKTKGRILSAACASANVAIDRARRMIASGMCDLVIVGACDLVSEFAFSGFASLGAMTAERARPYDRNRSGLLLGEAAGILILASERAAKGHEVSAWITGSAIRGDALHITAPRPDGAELERAIRMALGPLPPEEIAAVIQPQFEENDTDTIAAIVSRYYEQDTWKDNLIFEEDAFTLLQNILEEAGELEKRVPYGDLVNTDFAEKVK